MSTWGLFHRCRAAADARTEQVGLTLHALHGGLVCWSRGRIRPAQFDARKAGYLVALLASVLMLFASAGAWRGLSYAAFAGVRSRDAHLRPECILTCERCGHTTWLHSDQLLRLRRKNGYFYCERCQVFRIRMVEAGSAYCAAPAAEGVWP
jgi:hypothetical protein